MLYHLEPAIAHDEDESHDYVDVVNGYLYKTEGEVSCLSYRHGEEGNFLSTTREAIADLRSISAL